MSNSEAVDVDFYTAGLRNLQLAEMFVENSSQLKFIRNHYKTIINFNLDS